ncbi:MAG: hypothetical protein AAF219_07615 [Myxococcota bacterium]
MRRTSRCFCAHASRLLLAGLLAIELSACEGSLEPLSQPTAAVEDPTDDENAGDDGAHDDDGPRDDRVPDTSCDEYVAPSTLSAARKVKNILSGMTLSDQEVVSLQNDPDTLRGLVDMWFDLPSARAKWTRFFGEAFQQTGFSTQQLARQFASGETNTFGVTESRKHVMQELRDNAQDMFTHTVMDLVDNDRPFNAALTTRRFMLTPALMMFLAYHDQEVISDDTDDEGRLIIRYRDDDLDQIVYQNVDAYDVTDFDDAQNYGLDDPTDPNFMRFYVTRANLFSPEQPGCTAEGGELVIRDEKHLVRRAFRSFLGADFRSLAGRCREGTFGGYETRIGFLRDSDFSDWRIVTIRAPGPGEPTHRFYDLDEFRDPEVDELVLNTPRVGFMTTLAFLSRWETNDDNQARVTANQMLIVALGESIDDADLNLPITEDALDEQHADPSTACYACHRVLDPMRQYFRRDYTYRFSHQEDEAIRAVEPGFAWRDTEIRGGDIASLAGFVATHPRFAEGWVQKLCYYANSERCPERSAEFDRIAQVFRDSGYSFRTLVGELYTSSLITGDVCHPETEADSASISRRRHLCSTLEQRLERDDVCRRGEARRVVSMVPDDGFSRGDAAPITLREPSLVVSASVEKICESNAKASVGSADERYQASLGADAIPTIVTELAGHPTGDPVHEPMVEILTRHYESLKASERSDLAALRSVFVVACMSPSVVGVGF